MLRRLVLLFANGCLLASAMLAADVSGIWNGQFTDRNGDLQDVSFRFEQAGDKLAGKMYGDNESTPIADAKIDGAQISFSVDAELNGQVSHFVYTGTIENGEINVTREKIPAKPGANQKQTIRLKRVG